MRFGWFQSEFGLFFYIFSLKMICLGFIFLRKLFWYIDSLISFSKIIKFTTCFALRNSFLIFSHLCFRLFLKNIHLTFPLHLFFLHLNINYIFIFFTHFLLINTRQKLFIIPTLDDTKQLKSLLIILMIQPPATDTSNFIFIITNHHNIILLLPFINLYFL